MSRLKPPATKTFDSFRPRKCQKSSLINSLLYGMEDRCIRGQYQSNASTSNTEVVGLARYVWTHMHLLKQKGVVCFFSIHNREVRLTSLQVRSTSCSREKSTSLQSQHQSSHVGIHTSSNVFSSTTLRFREGYLV
jgi:hypothetical protein